MFVLPPPGPFPKPNIYHNVNAVGVAQPVLETTSNSLKHPTGPEYQFTVGEGTYTLRDDLHLATPLPHPSEMNVTNPNPLTTTPAPPVSGVKLSLATVGLNRRPGPYYGSESLSTLWPNLATYSIKESEKESRNSTDASSDEVYQVPHDAVGGRAPAFGAGNASLARANAQEPTKRRKPKTSMIKSNSSFVSRVIPNETISKRLQERNPEGLFAFANINRAFQWLDLSASETLKADHLTKILFTKAHMLCHDINPITRSNLHMDVIMGSSAGDIIWYEPISQKYARLNKNGVINPAPISDIHWIPGSENLFLASHMDGNLIVYDKEREDAAFIPEELQEYPLASNIHEDTSIQIHKSVNSRNQKTNPVSSWKISNQRINAFAFSPDSRHIAVVSEDGSFRIIDYLKETLLDSYTSYYGGFTCVCWSPDGKYVLTGGQDDLVSIWSLADRQIVARCPGHHSWVTCVAFDPWRCDNRNYRFGSVGEDCRLLLWDFNVSMLHRPKAASVRRRGSVTSYTPVSRRAESQMTARLRSNSSLATTAAEGDDSIEHPVESRTRTAELPPVMSKMIDDSPLCFIGFEETCIITSSLIGHIRTWDRPSEKHNERDTPAHAGIILTGHAEHPQI